MKIRMRYALPVLLALAGCATTTDSTYTTTAAATPAVAAPASVDAASDALGAKIDNMLASRRPTSTSVTR